MAYRKLTNQISHRNPFYGYGYYHTPDMYDFDIASIDKLYKGVQGEPQQFSPTIPVAGCSSCSGMGQDMAKVAIGSLISGAVIGVGTYLVARWLGKPISTSKTWALLGGGLIAATSLVADTRRP